MLSRWFEKRPDVLAKVGSEILVTQEARTDAAKRPGDALRIAADEAAMSRVYGASIS